VGFCGRRDGCDAGENHGAEQTHGASTGGRSQIIALSSTGGDDKRRAGRTGRARRFLIAACTGALTLGLLGFTPTLHAANPNGEPDANTDPELERQSFKVADGFEVNLFASDPMIQKPIEMNFDAAGRLWVATSETYPLVKPGQVANDKVVVLEDTTGSGKADKSTVFADGLLIPTGVAPGDGGCYVANSTEIDFLKNTKASTGPQLATGDVGQADYRRAILAGFGTEDTHHIVHAFHWGPDGRLYFNQSIYIHTALETPTGTKRLYGGGVWRFDPRTMDLGVFVTGMVNGWGDVWDRWGNAFGTDGAYGEGINYFIPGAAFVATPNTKRVLTGLTPGSPKYASVEVLSGRHMTDDVQGDFVTNDFRANRIVRFKLSDAGAGYSAKIQPDFITSTDKAFRPIDVKMGPDGALYICDWYNPIINHGEVDFRDSRRDHVHGRIWRVTAKGRPLVARPKLVGVAVKDVLEHLLDPEDWARLQARLVMRERGAAEVAPELAKWVAGLEARHLNEEALAHARLEALWAYECIDTLEPKLLETLLKSPNANARGAAAGVVANWARQLDDPTHLLAPLVADENPRVRLMAVRALASVGTADVVPLAAKVLDRPMDPFLDYALFKTCTDLEPVWMPAFKAGKLNDWADPSHLAFALKAVQSPEALSIVVEQLKSGHVTPESRRDIFGLISAVGGPADIAAMLQAGAFSEKADDATKVSALEAAALAARQRRIAPQPAPGADLQKLIGSSDPQVAAEAAKLAGVLHDGAARADLERLASSADTPETVRLASIEGLAEIGRSPKEGQPLFEKLTGAENPPAVRAGGVVGLTYIDVKEAAAKAADWMASAPAGADPGPVLSAFLHKQGGADALAAALGAKTLSPDSAKLSLRYLQGVGQDAPSLTEVLKKATGVAAANPQLSPEQMAQLMAEVNAKGDAGRGEKVFRSKVTGCYQCHAIGGAGGTLAPDLRAISSSPLDYIVNAVLLPNKDIKDGYDSLIVATKDGDLIQGIKVREDKQELVLRDNTRDEISIPIPTIKSRKPGGSLMPSGLADPLTHGEFVDLLRFLSELGKPGAFAVPETPVVRRWRVLDPVPAALAADPGKFPAGERLTWTPAYSLVAGALPADALPASPVAFVQANIDLTTAGKVRLVFNSVKGLSLWVDGKAVDLKQPEAILDLPRGVRTLTLRLDTAARGGEGIRLEVSEAPGTAAHVQVVGGK
jgi:putative heme-binding domain-containing protein